MNRSNGSDKSVRYLPGNQNLRGDEDRAEHDDHDRRLCRGIRISQARIRPCSWASTDETPCGGRERKMELISQRAKGWVAERGRKLSRVRRSRCRQGSRVVPRRSCGRFERGRDRARGTAEPRRRPGRSGEDEGPCRRIICRSPVGNGRSGIARGRRQERRIATRSQPMAEA